MAIDKFKLPREDWYDTEGRIYKNALIENFNAIEQKLFDLVALNPIDIILPDIANKDYEETTLESPDTKVVNLRSFIKIMNLVGFPIVCNFVGKELKTLSYYDKEYKPHTIVKPDISDIGDEDGNRKKFVLLNYTTHTVYVSENAKPNAEDVLIGVYDKATDSIVCIRHENQNYVDIDVLSVLSNMKVEPFTNRTYKNSGATTWFNKGRIIGEWYNGKYGWDSDTTFYDYGRITRKD